MSDGAGNGEWVAVFELDGARIEDRAPVAEGAEFSRTIEAGLIAENVSWFINLRWVVAGVFATFGLVGCFPKLTQSVGLRFHPVVPLLIALVLSALNMLYLAARRRIKKDFDRILTWGQILLDLILLTFVVNWVGWSYVPLGFAYLFHLVLACMVFPGRRSFFILLSAAFLYGATFLLHITGYLPDLSVFIEAPSPGWGIYLFWTFVGTVMVWTIVWYLVSKLAGRLLQKERALMEANRRLELSFEDRARHMLQTTHQLKAPLASIYTQIQMLRKGYYGELPLSAADVLGKIEERCKILTRQIQTMVQLANLRSEAKVQPKSEELDAAALVKQTVERLTPSARQRELTVELDLAPCRIWAAADHWVMVVENLVLNAITYSKPGGVVQVKLSEKDGYAVLEVRDEGIGIKPEKLPYIFNDYYRTEEAAEVNPVSTGLGLAIVRDIIRAVKGRIRIETAPGKGTAVTVFWPVRQQGERASK